jgi:hypothetical protein
MQREVGVLSGDRKAVGKQMGLDVMGLVGGLGLVVGWDSSSCYPAYRREKNQRFGSTIIIKKDEKCKTCLHVRQCLQHLNVRTDSVVIHLSYAIQSQSPHQNLTTGHLNMSIRALAFRMIF